MQRSRGGARIIRVLALAAVSLALAACSMARLGYSQGHELAFWWLDGYAGFNGEQSPQVRAALRDWFAWHRNTQLPDYADLLAQAQRQVLEPTTPRDVCRWVDEFGRRIDVAVEQALPRLAEVALALTPEQMARIEQRIAKSNEEFRDEYLQGDPARRQRESVRRAVDRFETVYGRLDRGQRERLAEWVAASPFDPERWFAERVQRQQDLLDTLRTLRALPAAERTPDRARQMVAGLAERFSTSPRPAYRDYQQRLRAYNCDVVARLHNATTAAQRQAAQATLRGWEQDARALAGQAGAP